MGSSGCGVSLEVTLAHIVSSGQTTYVKRPDAATRTDAVLAEAARQALDTAGLRPVDIDGLAVASFTLQPDHAIDLGVRLGLRLEWLMDSCVGGASGVDMVQHALGAIASGQARRILVLGGDVFHADDFRRLVAGYNRSMVEDFAGIEHFGPNAMFALMTQRQMAAYGLDRADYGSIVCRQREWAASNPNAVYREPLSLDGYLAAPVVAAPLTILDCVPVVAGANAIVIERDARGPAPIAIRGVAAAHNADLHLGDGTSTGLSAAAPRLWSEVGFGPHEVRVLSLYDDYPAVVVAQLVEAGFVDPGDVAGGIRRLLASSVRLNSSGGQLSAGQCGAGAGLHGVVDVVRGLSGEPRGTKGVATGYGMVVNRYGACANAVALERA
jgi:acetyl-CoA acetyltransferase